jgi:hypothetical protein
VLHDEYIESFFNNIEAYLAEATVEDKRRTLNYKGSQIAARWAAGLWEIQLSNKTAGESIQRFYDPARAESAAGASRYFVDALLRMAGEEPLPPLPAVGRFRKTAAKP